MTGGVDPLLVASDIRWTLAPPPVRNPLLLSDEELVVETLAEADAYRLLAQVALARIATLQRNLDRLREQHHELIDKYQAHRERAMREAVPS